MSLSPTPEPHSPDAAIGEGAARILIVDDDRVSRVTLSGILRRDGYQLALAENGQQGLLFAEQGEPDLILLDVVMPDLDGFEVCRRLRHHPHLAEVPVVMLTSLDDRPSRLRGLEAGADDFLAKPCQPEELRARVRTITRLNRYRRLRTERARFGWVVEQADDGYLVIGCDGALRYANARARQLLGWSDRPPLGGVLEALSHQFSLHPEGAWDRLGTVPEAQPLYLWRPESEAAPAVWLEVKALRQQPGETGESLLRLRDVTAEQSSQRSVWSFESVIAHKVRTPLTRANLGLSMLRRKASSLSPEQVAEFAEQAQQGLDELKRELDKVLQYVYSPRGAPQGAGFALEQLSELLDGVARTLEVAPVRWIGAGPEKVELHIDPRAFELILWEVLENSKKFHPTQNPQIAVCLEHQEEAVVLRLWDDGRRLTPRELERAFEPYFQGEKSFTGQVPGMGLGLAKLRSLLWEVGGDCWLANRAEAEGVQLTLRIPLFRGEGAPGT